VLTRIFGLRSLNVAQHQNQECVAENLVLGGDKDLDKMIYVNEIFMNSITQILKWWQLTLWTQPKTLSYNIEQSLFSQILYMLLIIKLLNRALVPLKPCKFRTVNVIVK